MRGFVVAYDSATGAGFAQAKGKDFHFVAPGLALGQAVQFSPSDTRGEFEAFYIEPAPATDPGSREPRPPLSRNGSEIAANTRIQRPHQNGPGSVRPDLPDGKISGTIEFYDDARGFGFLRVPGRRPDTFFHVANYRGAIAHVGQRVEFYVEPGRKRLEAKKITPVLEVESNE